MLKNIPLETLGYVVAALLTAALVAFGATPVVKNLAFHVGAVDVPKDGRRMHDHPIPRLGGVAILLGFLFSMLLFVPLTADVRGMLLGGIIIAVLGMFDDIYDLPAKLKLVVQICAALVAVLSGNVIEVLSNPNVFSENLYWELGPLAIPVTVIWIVALTNAVNFIDGLDGLAAGVSALHWTWFN
jgi:UDP-GlcNAc:undecaprenyl-phosphate GlcNAc-1-phosphate transferase